MHTVTVWLKIEMSNEVFREAPTQEVARILRKLADNVDGHPHFSDGHFQSVMDVNGNEVGWLSVVKKPLHLVEEPPFLY